VRYVGGGHRPQARGTGNGAPLRPSAASTDDLLLHDEDTRSVGASSYVSAAHSVVQLTTTARPPPAAAVPQAVARRATFEISRESSKESSNSESDEQLDRGRGINSGHNRGDQAVLKSRISQSSLSSEASRQSGGGGGRATTPPPPAHSPTASRRSTRLMVKSYSQDTPNELGKEGTNPRMKGHLQSYICLFIPNRTKNCFYFILLYRYPVLRIQIRNPVLF
jgi:hypothetical protein